MGKNSWPECPKKQKPIRKKQLPLRQFDKGLARYDNAGISTTVLHENSTRPTEYQWYKTNLKKIRKLQSWIQKHTKI